MVVVVVVVAWVGGELLCPRGSWKSLRLTTPTTSCCQRARRHPRRLPTRTNPIRLSLRFQTEYWRQINFLLLLLLIIVIVITYARTVYAQTPAKLVSWSSYIKAETHADRDEALSKVSSQRTNSTPVLSTCIQTGVLTAHDLTEHRPS